MMLRLVIARDQSGVGDTADHMKPLPRLGVWP
jgi:hypothetical protein